MVLNFKNCLVVMMEPIFFRLKYTAQNKILFFLILQTLKKHNYKSRQRFNTLLHFLHCCFR